MTEPFVPRHSKVWRKKRVMNGTQFVDQQSAEVKQIEDAKRNDSGLYCRACKSRRPWRRLNTTYEKQGTDLIRVWSCDQCNNVLREDNLEDR